MAELTRAERAKAAVQRVLNRAGEHNTLTGSTRVLITADEWEALRAWVFDQELADAD